MNPLVSVIVPVYNTEKYLPQCLESILRQTYTNLEIICIDDGSEDSSWEVLGKYALQDSRINTLKKENEGVSLARNYALEFASGEYILFVDSDDWIELETIECAVATSKKHSADVVMWSYIREMKNDSRKKHIFVGETIFTAEDVKTKLYRRMIGLYGEQTAQPENMDALGTIWGKLYRADLIKNNNICFYDIRRLGTYEDGLFNLETFAHVKKAVFIEKYFYHYRRDNEDSLTFTYKPNLPQQWDTLFALMREHIEKKQLDKTFETALANRIALSTISLGLSETECYESFASKYRKVRNLLAKPHYREAIKEFDVTYLPIHWKVFFLCAKMHWALGVYLLLMVIQKIRGK